MPLMKVKTEVVKDFSRLTALLYGPSKIGKTTFAASIENAYFAASEKGYNNVSVYKSDITKWEDFVLCAKEFCTEKHEFSTLVVDTIDNVYKLCQEYVCKKANITHPGDLGFGKGWSLVTNEFRKILTRLSLTPYGLLLISHSHEKEIDTRTGKIKKTVPTLPESAREVCVELVDMILFCDFEQGKDDDGNVVFKRVIRTKPTSVYDAGDRTGKLPEVIELDYNKFITEFNKGVKV